MNQPFDAPTAVSSDDRTMAMLAHLLGILTAFIGPLVIWLINKDKPEKAFVNDQAKEALNFQITVTIAYIVASALSVILIGLLLIPVIMIANLVLCILAGFIVPLIIWLINKDKPEKSWLTDQSKEALNFQITIAIALVACVVLSVVLIGAFLMPIVGLLNLIFCILGGIKANNGETYRYPFALRLIK